MQDKIPVQTRYNFDPYLMHLVQEITKRPTAEIIAFFYELTSQVAEIGADNRRGRSIRKHIVDYFPGTSVPFKLLVKGWKSSTADWDQATKQYVNRREVFSCEATVSFPESRMYMKEEELKRIQTALMEKALLGGEDVVVEEFKKPEIRTPKMYKPLMDAFAGRPVEEKKPKRKKKDE